MKVGRGEAINQERRVFPLSTNGPAVKVDSMSRGERQHFSPLVERIHRMDCFDADWMGDGRSWPMIVAVMYRAVFR